MKLFKSSTLILANIFAAFAKWIIVVIFAKEYIPSDIGVYMLALSITAPIVLLTNMKLRNIFMANEYDYSQILVVRLIGDFLSISIIAIFTYVVYEEYFIIIFCIAIIKIFENISDIFYGKLHKKLKYNKLSIKIFTKNLMIIISLLIIVNYIENFTLAIVTYTIIAILFTLIIDIRFSLKINIDKSTIIKIILIGIPLGLSQFVYSIGANMPRYYIEALLGIEELGYFSVIFQISVLLTIISTSLIQLLTPITIKWIKNSELIKLRKVVINYNVWFLLSGVTLFYLVPDSILKELIILLFGTDYSSYSFILKGAFIYTLINFSVGLLDLILINFNFSMKLLIINFSNTILVSICSGFLIGSYGLIGAIYSLIIFSLVSLFVKMSIINKDLIRGENKIV